MPDALIIEGLLDGRVGVSYRREGQSFPESAGEPVAFTAPFGSEELAELRWYLERYLAAPYGEYETRGQRVAEQLEAWGEALFRPIFGPGAVGHTVYQRAREREVELLIRSASPAFLALPWELMRDSERPTPLALDLKGISRSYATAGAAFTPVAAEALRVLMVISRPGGLEDVDFQMVARPLHDRLGAVAGQVLLEVARPPTLEALEERLRSALEEGRPYHVLHFDGHGVFVEAASPAIAPSGGAMYDARGAGGVLLFEDAGGGHIRVPAEDFAQVVKRGRVPLVVMNACQSAMVGARDETAATTVATRLLAEGVGAVVAMSHSVYAVAAAEFMAAFYDALFEGRDVVEAMTAGRRRLKRRPERPSPKGPMPLADWMVPVLYARIEIGFPHLARKPAGGPTLDAVLDAAAAPSAAMLGTGVHAQETIEAPAAGFVGRGGAFYTLELAARLQRVALIHGPGGTGKTELAKGFARWWRDTGGVGKPDWVFFHSFEPGVASFGLEGVVNAIGVKLFGADFFRLDGARRSEEVLKTLRGHPMLLVWDNFETVASMPDPGGVTPPLDAAEQGEIVGFLAALARPGGRSAVLITSRTEEPWLGGVRRVALGGLRLLEAAEYADRLLAPFAQGRSRWRDPKQRRDNAALMEWLDGHPLSMRLILPHLDARPAGELLAGLKGMGPLPEVFLGEGRTEGLAASVRYSLDHMPTAAWPLLPALCLFEGVVDVDVLGIFSGLEGVPPPFAGVSTAEWTAVLDSAAGLGLLSPMGGRQYALQPALPGYLAAEWRATAGADAETQRRAILDKLAEAHAHFGGWLRNEMNGDQAARAMGLVHAQRRTLGAMAAHCLEQDAFGRAQAILQPLTSYLTTRGLAAELRQWLDRCLAATEAAGPVDFDTEAGDLWLFSKGGEAQLALDAHRLKAAEAIYDAIRQALEAAAASEARDRNLATLYHQVGIAAQLRGGLDAAEAWYLRSLEIKEALSDRLGMAGTYYQLSKVAQRRGRLDIAETWCLRALEIAEALGDGPGMGRSYHQLSIVAHLRGGLDAAEAWCLRAIEIWEVLGDRPGMATTYNQLGIVAYLRGRLDDAEAWYLRSLEINEALGDKPGMAMSYHQLGMVTQDRRELDAAEAWYLRSLEINEALGDRPGMATTYNQLGIVAHLRDKLDAAEAWCLRALEITEALGDSPQVAASYHQLGIVAYLRGRLDDAEAWYLRSLEIKEALGDKPGMAMTYGQLGLLAEAQGDTSAGLSWVIRCVLLFGDFPHPATGPAPWHLARLYRLLGRAALNQAWRELTGKPVPDDLVAELESIADQGRGGTR